MRNQTPSIVKIASILVVMLVISSCKKDPTSTELELFELVQNTSSKTWYAMNPNFLEKSSGSAHSSPYLRTWFNSIASSNLDVNGKVKPNTSFTEGALIVKELYNSKKELELYAILYKQPQHQDADEKGWVWGYIYPDKKVKEASNNKGKACISCHNQSGSIDYTLMNKYFP